MTNSSTSLIGSDARELVERDYDAIAPEDLPLWERDRVLSVLGRECDSFSTRRWCRATWRAGRRVVDTFCWWTLLPERMQGGGHSVDDWRSSPVGDAVRARLFIYEGWRFLRIVVGALVIFAPIAVLGLLQGGPRYETPTWVGEQTASVTVFVLGLTIVSLTVGGIVMWGQYRAARAHAERDPIQRWILRRDR